MRKGMLYNAYQLITQVITLQTYFCLLKGRHHIAFVCRHQLLGYFYYVSRMLKILCYSSLNVHVVVLAVVFDCHVFNASFINENIFPMY